MLPLKLDPGPATEILGRLPAPADEAALAADGAAAEERSAQLVNEEVAARCRRTIRRYQWGVGVLCAAAVVALVVTSLMTYAAQEQARDATRRADVRIEEAEREAARVVEQQARTESPVEIRMPTIGHTERIWMP